MLYSSHFSSVPSYGVVQWQKAVTAYFLSKQFMAFRLHGSTVGFPES